MKKLVCFMGAFAGILTACSTTTTPPEIEEAPVLSAYYSDWDRAVRADVDMQNMYIGTPTQITKPVDMYMAMALALKYNYTRRLASYKENLAMSNISTAALPSMAENLGYENASHSAAIPSDLKISWNLLDLSALHYQNGVSTPEIAAQEQTRKVVNNIMLETRSLYWKALAAQRLLPVIDDMSEYLVRVVDEINSRTIEMSKAGKVPSTNLLMKKRSYLENIKQLTELKKKFDTAQTEFVGLLGLYPSTEIKLAGAEYGNFPVPSLRAKIQQLEWLALTNRPELRISDLGTSKDELELVIKEFDDVDNSDYRQDPNYYNRKWAKNSNDLSMTVFEEVAVNNELTYNSLARQRMAHIVLNQVYLSWAMYQAAVEDYYLNMGVAATSEDIAEDITSREGAHKAISHLESARAIIDEANAFLSYVDVQDAIGRLYASVGMDTISVNMLNENPSVLAVQIKEAFDNWRNGIFSSDTKKAIIKPAGHKPPVDVSSAAVMPNVVVGTGTDVNISIPDTAFEKISADGQYTTVAGSLDDAGLPSWLKYDEKTRTFTGHPSLDDEGDYRIKVYALDKSGNTAVLGFTITVDNIYIQTMEYKGLTGYRRAKVYHKCTPGAPCAKNDI
ncbi:MAG: putative Ig domain-containing protein [Acetobacter sp.]|nr:putative Ig domain-containing protein [Acetobacter sp.]